MQLSGVSILATESVFDSFIIRGASKTDISVNDDKVAYESSNIIQSVFLKTYNQSAIDTKNYGKMTQISVSTATTAINKTRK
jgi:hypothetical protein